MKTNFDLLKNEVKEMVINISDNEKQVIILMNAIAHELNSKLTVRKNMSIASFETLLNNSKTAEDLKKSLSMLDAEKEYEIMDQEGLEDSIKYNEECKKDNEIEAYENYKKFLDSRIKLNDNLYVLEYI